VQAARHDSAQGGFTHATRAREQIGVMQTLLVERMHQCLQHMLLPYHVLKGPRAPFARQHLITHEPPEYAVRRAAIPASGRHASGLVEKSATLTCRFLG